MAKKYQVNGTLRLVNRLMARLIRWNIAPAGTYLLTVRGRKTGNEYSAPVILIERDGQRWLVSPYGEVNWLKNARAAGEVTITRGKDSETLQIQECSPQESAPILKEYLSKESIVRPYFDVQPDDPLESFEAEAAKHPVFLLVKK
jgi:deazaflavin-dependent oxidoreductase (nitroreductase family)